ncbi:hypothetical protein GTQ40_14220 [Flavobacteriaceae bacterium R38]|nr:hypothetical protein [Flavobacteriaceae bacterium R38]
MKIKKLCLPNAIFLALIFSFNLNSKLTAQVGIGTTTPDASSTLDIVSTGNNTGVLFPRLTTVQRNNILSPAKGLLIFNITTDTFDYNVGTPELPEWVSLSTSGNATTTPSSAKFSNIDTNTDLNFPTTSNLSAPIFGTEVWNDNPGLFVLVNDETLRVTESGRYKIQYNISIENQDGGNVNAGLSAVLRVNGINVSNGSLSLTGLMTNNNRHDFASLHLADVFELAENDEISIHIFDANSNINVITLEGQGTSTIYIEKIN